MKKMKRIMAMFMALLMMLSAVRVDVFAADSVKEVNDEMITDDMRLCLNPLYTDEKQELKAQVIEIQRINSKLRDSSDLSVYLEDLDEVAKSLTGPMVERQREVVVYVQMPNVEQETIDTYCSEIFQKAMAHTGNPLEGDSLKFVWKSYGCSLSGSYDGTTYYMKVIYSIEYLTDFEQETALTAAIENLKAELALEGLSAYEIVKAIYDYMTDNITYDYANLNDASYELKYTAYAALINKTAVCQGYAVLFYRLALEYGIDARVITGTSFGEGHAWNIVQLGDYYYDLDATWDAGSSKYNYFLKCEANFPDHTRNSEYLAAEFNAKYVMDDEDYKQKQSAADTMIETTDFTFVIENGKATLTKYKGSAQEVVIPGMVENYPVTKLGNLSFCDNDTIRKVTIPNSVESIESASEILVDGAFYHCDNLREVVFEEGSKIKDLGECTFMDAKSLTKIEIPSSVKALKLSLFENCESLKELELPEGVEVLHQNALSLTGITKLHLPSTLISYHEWTFMPYLEEITVAEGSELFRSHEGVLYYAYNGGWLLLGYPFAKRAETYHVADYATAVYGDLFGNQFEGKLLSLKTLYIGDCYGVSSDSACTISKVRCSVIPDETNPYYNLENNVLLSEDGTVLEQMPCELTGTVILPEGIETIVSYVGSYSQCQEIIFPSTLKYIGGMAFEACNNLEKVVFPYGLEVIDAFAFQYCEKLDNLIITKGVKAIGYLAFEDCVGLKTLYLSNNLEILGDSAFNDCYSIEKIYYSGSEDEWKVLKDGRVFWFDSAQVIFNAEAPCEHRWDKGTVVKEATQTTVGEMLYTCVNCHQTKTEEIPMLEKPVENPFIDVPENEYYAKPVHWAVEQGITAGLKPNQFAPEDACTRGQVVTFLWRAFGCPEPQSTTHNFTDLKASEYYYKAVLWAVENGITAGLKPNQFAPDQTVTRAQFVTFLHRAEGKPTYTGTNPFTDLKTGEYYYDAVLWAVENEVTAGLKPALFGPEEPCTRGQVVTFLYRAYSE